MRDHQKPLVWAIVLSETSHVFCCVLPTIFSVLSLLSGFGLAVTVPGWMESLHAVMHHWEAPMIVVSLFIVASGWGLYWYARKMDCHDHGCHHGACEPQKNISGHLLVAATVLLVFNLLVYFVIHRHQAEIMDYVHGSGVSEAQGAFAEAP